jgi:hypothetical protein
VPRFVLHEHQVPRHHFDLRLEHDRGHGPVLVSWAVPKGVPETEGVNRLAVAVPDHDMDHIDYTDERKSIAAAGTYVAHEFSDDKVVVTFADPTGHRLTGTYALIHTAEANWLLRRIRPR